MGVYIKGMKMPFTCLSCDFHKCAGGVGDYCTLTKKKQFRFKNRPLYCPLISVPEPHGRLIDADAVIDNLERTGWYDNADRDIAEDLVLDAPTVIPAEPPKEET